MEGGKKDEAAGCSSVVAAVQLSGKTSNNITAYALHDDEEEPTGDGSSGKSVPAPLVPLQHHLDKDDDDSLRRWKEKLLGNVEGNRDGQVEPEVTFHSIGIISDDLGENTTMLPLTESQSSRVLFSLKEGSKYRLKLTFTVKHNLVSGIAYFNTVWRGGIQVDQGEGMLGSVAPQQEPYVFFLDEEITPPGLLARGLYLAKLRFVDDDNKGHMELSYSFEIKKGS